MSRPLTPREADLLFFRRFAHRRHRIRVAARCEIEAARRRGGLTAPIPGSCRVHIGVRANDRGRLQYAIGALVEGADCDMDEADAAGAFALLLRQDDAHLTEWVRRKREVPPA